MKGLEALEALKEEYLILDNNHYFRCCLYIIEKELKALKIIKEKQVDIKWVGGLPPFLQQNYAISQEELNLLKEVLK